MKIFIAIVFGRSFTLNVNGADTISTIKQLIQDKDRCLLSHEYVLIYNGAILVDEKALSDYKIVEESIIQLKLQCNKTQQETIEEINRDLYQIKQLQEEQATQNYITLKIVDQDSNKVHFRVKYDTSMAKLKKSYAERTGVNVDCVCFLFYDLPIEDEETPEILEMEEDDVIEVYHDQSCCCSD